MRERRADGCKEGSEESTRKEGREEGTCQEVCKESSKEKEVAVRVRRAPGTNPGALSFGLGQEV